MKNLALSLVIMVGGLLFGQMAQAALVLEESFSYPDGNLNNQGGWTVSGGTAPATVEAGNLDVSGLPASSGKQIQMDGGGGTFTKADGTATLTNTVSGNAVYFSYILHLTDAASFTTTYETVSEVSIAGNFLCLIQMKDNGGGKVKFATRRATGGTPTSGSSNPTPYATNSSIFIVGKLEVNTGGNDIAKLWVDPSPATFGAATDPTTDASSTSGGTDPVNGAVFGGFRFTAGLGAEVDSLRIGRSWADVTSAGVTPIGEKLGFTTQPANAAPNATLNPIVVQVQTAGGAAVASNNVPVTLTLTGGTGTLSGTATQNTDATGKATFSNLSIDLAGTGKQLTATASGIGAGLTSAVSSNFSIVAPSVGVKLAFTTPPANALVNATMNAVVVQVQDVNNLAVASNAVPVTLNLTSGSGTLNGTLTQSTDASGKATFSNLSMDTAGAGKQLTAAAAGIGTGLASAVSGNFTITSASSAGAPVITQALMSVSGFILRGHNGTPGGNYEVLNTTNPARPLTLWSPIATNAFNVNGLFDCTNLVPPGLSQNYYRLRTAGGTPAASAAIGYASYGAGATGGGDTTNIVIVTDTAGLSNALVRMAGPLIIQVQGSIALRTDANTPVNFGNKTIEGIGTNAAISGDLIVENPENSNVIIRNLFLSNPNATAGDKDAITISRGATNVWVDHCDIYDCLDGGIDVVNGADFVTISWCRFYYNAVTTHKNVNLIGNSDTSSLDPGKLHVTFHHNWWDVQCTERMPSVRFGRVHAFNNYFNSPGNSYCIRTRLHAEVLAENNYFDHVNDAFEQYININTSTEPADAHGLLKTVGNILDGCTTNYTYILTQPVNAGTLVSSNATSITFDQDSKTFTIVNVVSGNDTLTPAGTDPVGLNPPPYPYTLDPASAVPNLVTNQAGAGRGPYAP